MALFDAMLALFILMSCSLSLLKLLERNLAYLHADHGYGIALSLANEKLVALRQEAVAHGPASLTAGSEVITVEGRGYTRTWTVSVEDAAGTTRIAVITSWPSADAAIDIATTLVPLQGLSP